MTILVVDDDPLTGELVAALLEASGWRCQLAEQGIAALEQLDADTSIALVISDLHMPLIDGLELCAEMRERGLAQPFVLLTGTTPADIGTSAAPPTAVLPKDDQLEAALPALVAQLLSPSGDPP